MVFEKIKFVFQEDFPADETSVAKNQKQEKVTEKLLSGKSVVQKQTIEEKQPVVLEKNCFEISGKNCVYALLG